MKIYFNSTFIETKRETDDLFVKGNNGNKLEAYFEDLDLSNVNISLRLVIGWSNGELTNELPMNKSFDNQYAYINLPKLKHDGNTQFIIKIYQNGTLLQTAIFTRNIKATLEANDNTNIGSDEYQGLSNQIKDIDDKSNSNSTRINELQETINDVSNASQDNAEAIELNKTKINQLQQSLNTTDSDIANLETKLDKLEDGLADGKIELTNYVTKEEFNVVANASQDNAEKLKQVYTIEEVDIEVNDLRQEVGNKYYKQTELDPYLDKIDNIENAYIKSVQYNIQTGIFTFTRQDGSFYEVDLAIEKVVNNYVYNSKTQALELTLADGTVQSIPLTDFIKAYEGVENDQIQVSVQSGNKIQAVLKDGSININHLDPKFANDVNTVFTAVGELQNHVQDNAEAITNLQESVETLESKFTADLTGSKWTLFNPLPDDTPDFEYNLTFVSNGATFTKIAYNKEQYIGLAYINSSGGVTTAYNASDKIWSETNYQTIEITGGTDVTNLETIGTLKTIGARISGGINVDDNIKAELEALNIRVNGVSARVTALEQNQGSGGGSSGAVSSSIFESVTINDFSALEEAQGPYTHFAEVTLTNSLDDKASVELLNNNAVLFATYGFAIASVSSGNVVTVYSINKSAEAVTLTFEIVKAYKVWDGSYTEGTGASLITFTHNHYSDGITTYQAEEGMTWEEFINSDYNTNDIFMLWSGGGVTFNNASNGVQDASGNFMVKTDIITSQEYYTRTHSTGSGGN